MAGFTIILCGILYFPCRKNQWLAASLTKATNPSYAFIAFWWT